MIVQILALGSGEVEAAIHEALVAGVMITGDDGELRLAHDLLRETLATRVDPARRVATHQVIADALERQNERGFRVANAAEIARHFMIAIAVDGPLLATRWALAAASDDGRAVAFTEAAGRSFLVAVVVVDDGNCDENDPLAACSTTVGCPTSAPDARRVGERLAYCVAVTVVEPESILPTGPRSTARRALLVGAALVVIVVLSLTAEDGPLTPIKAIVLGAVEGITEFLPISSTGHLLVTQRLLGLGTGDGKLAADTYAIAIQLGAILAVVALYRQRIVQLAQGAVGRDVDGRVILVRLVIAFAPAAAIGLVFGGGIKDRLFGPWPVVAAWLVGGVFLRMWRPTPGATTVEMLTMRSALIIGCVQILALWPGTSRSLVTIVAALAVGLSMSSAVEFSFLLGLATLSAATALDLAKDGGTLLDEYGWRTPLLGTFVAFVSAVVAVKWLVGYLRTRPLTIFGWYRIGVAALTVALIAGGAI